MKSSAPGGTDERPMKTITAHVRGVNLKGASSSSSRPFMLMPVCKWRYRVTKITTRGYTL